MVEVYFCNDGMIEVYEDKNGKWRWRVLSDGGVIGSSHKGFKDKGEVRGNLRSLVDNAQGALDVEYYEDRRGLWRWRAFKVDMHKLKIRNIKEVNLIASSSEGFDLHVDAINNIESVKAVINDFLNK